MNNSVEPSRSERSFMFRKIPLKINSKLKLQHRGRRAFRSNIAGSSADALWISRAILCRRFVRAHHDWVFVASIGVTERRTQSRN